MIYRIVPLVTRAVTVVCVVSSLALAGPLEKTLSEERFEGTVIRVDAKGGATVKTTEGREYNIQGMGLQIGDKIACGQHGDGMCEKILPKPPAKTK
jgi:hypothetical protein